MKFLKESLVTFLKKSLEELLWQTFKQFSKRIPGRCFGKIRERIIVGKSAGIRKKNAKQPLSMFLKGFLKDSENKKQKKNVDIPIAIGFWRNL